MPTSDGRFRGISVPRLPWMLEPTIEPEFEDMGDVSEKSIEADKRIQKRIIGEYSETRDRLHG